MTSADGPRRPRGPYWLLAVIAVVIVSPPTLVALAVVGAAILSEVGVQAFRSRIARERSGIGRASAAGVPLGTDRRGNSVVLSDRQLSAHALILGASGAGKSTTLLTILTQHVRRGRPVVAIDLKGSPDFARELADASAAAGRRFRLWTPDGPGLWNPLAHGSATELKDKLISTERFTEPHYQRAAERYVQMALQVLLQSRPGVAPTLSDVVDAMDPSRMARLLRDVPYTRAARVQDYLAGLTPDQLSAIRGLGTRLAIISESDTGRFFERSADGIDLRAALAGRDVVLFSLNSSSYGKLAAQIGTLVIQDLITAVGDRLRGTNGTLVGEAMIAPRAHRAPAAAGADPAQPARGADPHHRALIGIDEFSALGADNVIALLARGREARVSVLLATQELADLDRAAPGLRDQVLGNTAVKIAHRQDVPSSAQTIAQMIGTEATWEHTHQTSGGGLLPGRDTGRGSRRAAERFIVHPNEIKSLPTGDAVVITKLPSASARTVRIDRGRGGEGLGR